VLELIQHSTVYITISFFSSYLYSELLRFVITVSSKRRCAENHVINHLEVKSKCEETCYDQTSCDQNNRGGI